MKLLHQQIQYIEFLSEDFTPIKEFYSKAFGWEFTDFGSKYTAFAGDNIDGGFAIGKPTSGSILPILYSSNLEETQSRVEAAGGIIAKEIFSFPGGRRFHFTDPDNNELAVWTDT